VHDLERDALRAATRLPSTRMWPARSHSCRRLREYWPKSRASAWSSRRPPMATGTVAFIGAASAASQSL